MGSRMIHDGTTDGFSVSIPVRPTTFDITTVVLTVPVSTSMQVASLPKGKDCLRPRPRF
jgi:hypothetical protein